MSACACAPAAALAFALALCACGGASYGAAARASLAPASPAQGGILAATDGAAPAAAVSASTAVQPQLPEQVVVEGQLEVAVDDAAGVAGALRAWVEGAHGRVVSDQVDGAAQSWHAQLKLRLPPAQVDPLVAWLDHQGDITSKRIQATDVSRTLFDQDIALTNLRVTLERLRKLLDAGGLSMQDILSVEKEMTRLRGEIEQLEGQQRFLKDRVAFATLDVEIRRREGAVLSPRAKVYPGPRLAVLTLFSPDGRKRTRLGAGAVMHIVVPGVTLELDVFQGESATSTRPSEGAGVLATYGARMYSDFLGRGRRSFANPYLGFRLGYGHIGYSAFAGEAEAGLEVYKSRYLLVDANLRALWLLGDGHSEGALVSGGSLVFAF